MSPNQFRPDRLLKLADHLENGKMLHEEFDFGVYHCGTSGCAMGEMPAVFPEDWKTSPEVVPVLRAESGGTSITDGSRYFGISIYGYAHLFLPGEQNVKLYGGKTLGSGATKKQVAANIRAFVERMCPNEKV